MNFKNLKFIRETFLKLVEWTYPYGYESVLVENMISCGVFPNDLLTDEWGNYFYKIGESDTIFTAHLDTCCDKHQRVNYQVSDDYIVRTDGNTILGADDKAGVTLMLFLIKNKIPGLYYFFVGEEVGCIGSRAASVGEIFRGYKKMISFDRRGTNSVITFQSSRRTSSDKFANELAKQINLNGTNLNYMSDDTGVCTDSLQFEEVIPECTNISIGYMNEHRVSETQDLYHLTKLSEACLRVKWDELPVARDPSKVEFKSSSRWGNYNTGGDYNYEDFEDYMDSHHRDSQYMEYDPISGSWTNGSMKSHSLDFDNYMSGKRGKRGNKRGNKRVKRVGPNWSGGRKFYDSVEGLLSMDTDMYDIHKDKLFLSEFTKEEFEILLDQYDLHSDRIEKLLKAF